MRDLEWAWREPPLESRWDVIRRVLTPIGEFAVLLICLAVLYLAAIMITVL